MQLLKVVVRLLSLVMLSLMGEELLLKGLVGNVESGSILRAENTGTTSQPKALGELVANQLLEIGAGKLLEGG